MNTQDGGNVNYGGFFLNFSLDHFFLDPFATERSHSMNIIHIIEC